MLGKKKYWIEDIWIIVRISRIEFVFTILWQCEWLKNERISKLEN